MRSRIPVRRLIPRLPLFTAMAAGLLGFTAPSGSGAWAQAVPAAPAIKTAGATAAADPASADSILALVDGEPITRRDFTDGWDRILPSDRPEGDAVASRQKFLDRLVERKLMAREARKRNYPLTSDQQDDLAHFTKEVVKTEVFKADVMSKVKLGDAELAFAQAKFSTTPVMRRFSFPDRQQATAWRNRLRSGTPVSVLLAEAEKHEANGAWVDTIGPLKHEDVADSLEFAVFGTKAGALSEVVELGPRAGFFQVLSVLERPSLESRSLDNLRESARQDQILRELSLQRAKLRAYLDVRYDNETCDYVVEKFAALPPRVTRDGGVQTMNMYIPLPRFEPADSARILARSTQGNYTLGRFLAAVRAMPYYDRPEIRTRTKLEAVADGEILGDEIYRRGVARGLDKTPEAVHQIQYRMEGYAVENYYDDVIMGKVPTAEDSIRAYYASKPRNWDTPEAVQVSILVVERKSLADSLAAEVRAGTPFSRLARAFSIHWTNEDGGNSGVLYRGRNSEPEMEPQFFSAPVGVVVGPVVTRGGFMVFRVEEKQPEVKRDFETARQFVEPDYRTEMSERILQAHLAQLRSKAKVEQFPERITADLGSF